MIKGAHRPHGKRQQKFQDEISLAVFAIDAGSCRLKGFSRSRFITRCALACMWSLYVCVCMCLCGAFAHGQHAALGVVSTRCRCVLSCTDLMVREGAASSVPWGCGGGGGGGRKGRRRRGLICDRSQTHNACVGEQVRACGS